MHADYFKSTAKLFLLFRWLIYKMEKMGQRFHFDFALAKVIYICSIIA